MINHHQELDGTLAPAKGGTANLGTTLRPINDIQAKTATYSGAVTVTGALTASGGVTGTITGSASTLPGVGPTSGALAASDSGKLCIGVVDAAFTLPLATVGAGVYFIIMTGVASAGTGLTIARSGSDTINTKTTAAGSTAITGATTITNTGATDVVWDYQVLVSDGVSKWYGIGMAGTWA